MTQFALAKTNPRAIPIWLVGPGDIDAKTRLPAFCRAWARANGFNGEKAKVLTVAGQDGKLSAVLFGIGKAPLPFDTGLLPAKLPAGTYRLEGRIGDPHLAALGWLLGAYRFDQYRKGLAIKAKLAIPAGVNRAALVREAEATYLARDLINIPANDMGPDELETAARKLGRAHRASLSVIRGDKLLGANLPMIHAVGRASSRAPRLIDLKWGAKAKPLVTLVGKGVIFDTGGLNLKPGNSMTLMKKDMGGAANVLALAGMIMAAKLPVRLRVLVPAVENAVSGNAFRPGDVLPSRKGISVEIGNTDAEGRLVLGDALALADEEKPDLLIDMATLTGAARVALGPDLPPFYTGDEKLASELAKASVENFDPLWRMPLWEPYQKTLSSKIADVNNISSGGFAGSITAALFLSRFVENAKSWVHFDIFGWVPSARPWAPVGGEAQGIRALFQVIAKRYG